MNYDPEAPKTWPAEQREAYDKVWHGLIDGDLEPLMRYLRSELPIPRSLRLDLADCISGEDTLHKIVAKKRRSGPGGIRDAVAYHQKIGAVAEYVERQLPKGRRGYLPRAISAAAKHFETTESNVRKMRSEFRKRAKAGHAGGVYHMRGWANLHRPKRL